MWGGGGEGREIIEVQTILSLHPSSAFLKPEKIFPGLYHVICVPVLTEGTINHISS